MNKSVFGFIGLGVMGKSISLNVAEKGVPISVYNRIEEGEAQVVKDFIDENTSFKNISGFTSISAFIESLEQPRKILLMIKAGSAIDTVIKKLIPLLSEDDIIIDGGNSHYLDTKRRCDFLKKKKISFVGCGISGGVEGARHGPSIMPGGTKSSYNILSPILESIAAKDSLNNPCCTYIGPGSSGHFIKMVHNGIEYAEMQLLAELYALMSSSMDNLEISKVFSKWNNTNLSSYLLEITSKILLKKEGDHYLIDLILDKAGNKGTGSWSSIAALNLGTPNTMMTSATFVRYLSSLKEKRQVLSKVKEKQVTSEAKLDLDILKEGYRFARIINHHQGFDLIKQASQHYKWKLNLSEIARIWTNGCIIRSRFMEDLITIYKNYDEILKQETIINTLNSNESAISELITLGITNRIALDTFWSAYNYWISITTFRLPANLIQAQRDYFGAHGYQRTDSISKEFFNTNWQK